jgi:hypothetical protein
VRAGEVEGPGERDCVIQEALALMERIAEVAAEVLPAAGDGSLRELSG